MSSPRNIVDEATKFVNIMKELMPTPRKDYVVDGVIHCAALREDIETINQAVEAFNIIKDTLEDLSSRITSCAESHVKAKKKLTEELAPMGKFAAKSTKRDDVSMDGIPRVDYMTDGQVHMRTMINADGSISKVPSSSSPASEMKASLNAIHVEHKNQVRSDGNLYFVRSINRFALRVNGHLLMGNIGEVYTHGGSPQKIKPCSNGRHCRDASCTYYHSDAGDVRNYISGSFSYQRRTDGISRKIGNRSTLAVDISKATKPEIELYQDQSIHDLLCHLVILDTQR
jgi:hypothetical protein